MGLREGPKISFDENCILLHHFNTPKVLGNHYNFLRKPFFKNTTRVYYHFIQAMYGLPEEVWAKWSRKRGHTLAGLVIIGTSAGIDCSVVLSTLFLYLRDVVKTEYPQAWYGVIMSSFFIASTVVGMGSGRLVFRGRCTFI